jgi:hypothetical protein
MVRGELAAVLYTAERISPMHAALDVLLGLNGAARQRGLRGERRGLPTLSSPSSSG